MSQETSDNLELTKYVGLFKGSTDTDALNHNWDALDNLLFWASEVGVNVRQFGALPIQESPGFDSTGAINAAIAHCVDKGVELYIPAGTFRTTGPIGTFERVNPAGKSIRIRGAGDKTIIKPDSNTDYDAIQLGANSQFQYSGYLKDIVIEGPTPYGGNGRAAVKLDEMRQFRLENLTVRKYEIGYDLINNCFGTYFDNCRTHSDVHLALNLRTGPQSGNDINFNNCWFNGRIGSMYISGGSGGFQFRGGQMAGGQSLTAPDDSAGVVVLGKDYLTGEVGPVGNVSFEGVDFEGFKNMHAFRTYGEVELNVKNCGMQPLDSAKPALSFLKGTGVGSSSITLEKFKIRGYWSEPKLINISGEYDGCSIQEYNMKYKCNIAGSNKDGASLLVQSKCDRGQALYRWQGFNILVLGKTMIRTHWSTGALEKSSDWGITWTAL
jgi:hypothetical protein